MQKCIRFRRSIIGRRIMKLLKNMKESLKDIIRCIKYFSVFAWKELPIYYFYIILGIMIQSVGPFISIIGTKYLINEIAYEFNRDMDRILFWAAFICLGNLLYTSMAKFAIEKQNYCNDQFDRTIHMQLSKRTMKMKFEYTENMEVLDKIKKAERAFEETNLVQGITDAVISIISNLIILAGVFYLVVSCSVVLLIPIILSFIVSSRVTMKNTKTNEEYYAKLSDEMRKVDYYEDDLSQSHYAKDIRIYDAGTMIIENQSVQGEKIYETRKKYQMIEWGRARYNTVVSEACNIFVYIILGLNTLAKKITIGDFSSLVQSTIQFMNSMNGMSEGIFHLKYTAAILKYFIEYVETVDFDIMEEQQQSMKQALVVDAPTIEFKNVCFKYPNTDVYILKNINTTIRAGEHLSIVGQNGAGKTTFIKLLCRLYDVTEGEILLDGVNIQEYAFPEYIKLLAVVFQDYKLMAFTIKENMNFSKKPDEDIENRIRELCQLVDIDDWIQSLDKKQETNLYKMFDESGIEPSGGQAQKLAIVRALYKDSPVVILDEPTAALDPLAEYEVYKNFDSLVGGKTAVYISHRLSSCRFCDRIIVFEGGTIVEDGSHQELVNIENGFYAKMYHAQAKHYQ